MNKQDLKNFIKSVVRENLENHVYKELLKEVSPPGEKAERMIQHVKASLRKNHPKWDEDKITSVAIATGWKAHNKGSVEEKDSVDEKKDKKWIGKAVNPKHKGYCTPMTKPTCTPRRKALAQRFKKGLQEYGYKIVPDTMAKVQKDDQARTVQTDPKMNEDKEIGNVGANNTCPRCHTALTRKNGKLQCDNPDCMHARRNHSFSITKVSEPKVNEASYKVVSPSQARCSKCDQARTIQSEPTMTESGKFGSCKGCGRVVDKGQDKCPKCREKQKSSLPPKKTQQGAKDPDRVPGVRPMKETAYKTQGPSLRTFDDSSQFPDNLNNPKLS